jgi:hypothetical protein
MELSRRQFLLSPLALTRCDPTIDDDMAILIPRPLLNIVCIGDSITYGRGASIEGGATSWPGVLCTALGLTYGTTLKNFGIPSMGFEDAPDPDYMIKSGYTNVCVIFLGTNNINSNGQTAAQTRDGVLAYGAAREARGWRVVYCTLPFYVLGDAGEMVIMSQFATAMRAAVPAAQLVDLAADPVVGLTAPYPGSPPIFDAEGHFVDLGYARIASLFQPYCTAASGAANITASVKPTIDSHLKMMLRGDWADKPITSSQVNPRIANHVGATRDVGYVTASSNFASYVRASLNGQPIIRFPGNCFYTPFTLTWADLITVSAFTIEFVGKVTAVSATGANAYDNHGLIADGANKVGIFYKSNGGGGAQVQGLSFDGGFKQTAAQSVTLSAAHRLRLKLSGGTLSLSVNGAAPQTVASGNLPNLTGTFVLGENPLGAPFFSGDLAELRIYDNADGTRDTANDAYDLARYGV